MNYYNVKDIMELTGLKQTQCYKIIKDLNQKYKKEYPNAFVTQGVVPIFFFKECMGFGKDDERKDVINGEN